MQEDLESFLMGRNEEIDLKLNNRNHTKKYQNDNQSDKHEIHNHRESKQAESAKIASEAHSREAPSKSTTERKVTELFDAKNMFWSLRLYNQNEKASKAFTEPTSTPTTSHDHVQLFSCASPLSAHVWSQLDQQASSSRSSC